LSIIESMMKDMTEAQARAQEQVRQVLIGTQSWTCLRWVWPHWACCAAKLQFVSVATHHCCPP
jgi:hypothetical protein